jgi:hypothetical protein
VSAIGQKRTLVEALNHRYLAEGLAAIRKSRRLAVDLSYATDLVDSNLRKKTMDPCHGDGWGKQQLVLPWRKKDLRLDIAFRKEVVEEIVQFRVKNRQQALTVQIN